MKYLNLGNTGQLFFNLENRNVLFFFFYGGLGCQSFGRLGMREGKTISG